MVYIAILGFGTVGSGVYEVITKNKAICLFTGQLDLLLHI